MSRLLGCIGMLLCIVCPEQIVAQETLVVGHVRSRTDKSPISAVNIYFEGTEKGVQSDDEGFYVIRNDGSESKLIFSCIGYKTQQVKIVPGETAGIEISLREDVHLLQDLFVLPGSNPALDLLRKVREAKDRNDVYRLPLTIACDDQTVVLIRKPTASRNAFRQLSEGLISKEDTTQFLPLYLKDEKYRLQQRLPRQIISMEAVATPENAGVLLEKLTGDLQPELNFYNNNIFLLGKYFVSPLSSLGNSYYRFFLIDSLMKDERKQYYVRFRTKNTKNLAFNGELWIDSASYALTDIALELPAAANLNYVNKLKIRKTYQQAENDLWYPESDTLSFQMTYQLLADSMHLSPEIFIYRHTMSTPMHDSLFVAGDYFAGSEFNKEELIKQLGEMNELPLIKMARWIADAVLTGYMQFGAIDVGKVYQLARITDIEGFRFSLPIRTNELFSKYFSIGGYWGYGTRNRSHHYSVTAAFKLPVAKKSILSVGYTDDLRSIDYNYTDYLLRENPLLSGDEDIANTIFAFRSSNKVHPRKELFISLAFDWNRNIESSITYRKHKYVGNATLPFFSNGIDLQKMTHELVTFNTRFSQRENTYEDHLDRIYIPNYHPVYYLTVEGGRAVLTANEHFYGKVGGKFKHQLLMNFGQWNYSVDAAWIIGTVPYNLLSIPIGNKTLMLNPFHYSLMNNLEYAYDKYIAMHHEWTLNGIVLNQIPVVRLLNLRELVTFKCIYGGLSNSHAKLMDFPSQTTRLKTPYVEVGVGLTNVFRLFSVQSVWRLSELNKPGVSSWGLIAGIHFSF